VKDYLTHDRAKEGRATHYFLSFQGNAVMRRVTSSLPTLRLPASVAAKTKFWRKKRSVTISDLDPQFRVTYLGNVLTGWAKGTCWKRISLSYTLLSRN